MSLDIANIYNLPDTERAYIQEHLWDEAIPGAEQFAECLMKDIVTGETPAVISLEAAYGMGKTFFCSRFNEYLNRNGIDSIYISLWANDYLPNPFLPISKTILNFFEHQNIPTAPSPLTTLTESALKVSKKLLGAAELNVNAGSIGVSLSLEKGLEAFYGEKDDPIKAFKYELTAKIRGLNEKRLVLIIDEIDRCRPDYALKAMEVLKHFFDVQGLTVLIPNNKQALRCAVQAVYHTTDLKDYLQKFFSRNEVYQLNLEKSFCTLVNQYISPKTLKHAIEIDIISQIEEVKKELIKSLTLMKLNLREATNILKEFIHIANSTTHRLSVSYIDKFIRMRVGRPKGATAVNLFETDYRVTESAEAHWMKICQNPLSRFEEDSQN